MTATFAAPPATAALALEDLEVVYTVRGIDRVVLRGVSFSIAPGEAYGLVGESGCGKSTLARMLTRLERPDSGRIEVLGQPIERARGRTLRELRRTIQLVFQDPYASLDPRQRVGDALAEVLTVHRLPGSTGELLEMVGLAPDTAESYPHQLSGGQRQRIGIARALAVWPKVLVLDEPVSALDVSVRAEIINLLVRLRAELRLTFVFISHDLGLVRHLADDIAVMYLGQIVEYGPWQAISDAPKHPYTRALQAAIPIANPELDVPAVRPVVVGEVPDPAAPPPGCRFHPRCPLVEDVCRTVEPTLLPEAGRYRVACHVVQREAAVSLTKP
jgi:oligopeptide/dipeptide ABC transporter ATP-binding protein